MRLVHVHQHGSDARTRDAEQQTDEHENQNVEEKRQKGIRVGNHENGGDERQRNEIANAHGHGKQRLVEGASRNQTCT